MNKKRGGKRPNAGRKKYTNADEYKEEVTIYVKKYKIKEHGGKPALKKKLLKVAECKTIPVTFTTSELKPKIYLDVNDR